MRGASEPPLKSQMCLPEEPRKAFSSNVLMILPSPEIPEGSEAVSGKSSTPFIVPGSYVVRVPSPDRREPAGQTAQYLENM